MAGHAERGEVPGTVTLVSRRGEAHAHAVGNPFSDNHLCNPGQSIKASTLHESFLIFEEISYLSLPRGRGLSWGRLKTILEITTGQFRTQAERRFVDDVIDYLDYKSGGQSEQEMRENR
jgi:hypothetical protein